MKNTSKHCFVVGLILLGTMLLLLQSTDAYATFVANTYKNSPHLQQPYQYQAKFNRNYRPEYTTQKQQQTIHTFTTSFASSSLSSLIEQVDNVTQNDNSVVGNNKERIIQIKDQIINLSERTNRGFNANKKDRDLAIQLIQEISQLNPTKEPAKAYYTTTTTVSSSSSSPSIQGKWTLVYTDAPDITSLDQSPLSTLGRIGQECTPPYIKNVIEYTKPSWVQSLPFSGTIQSTRILQKVITKASATPSNPTKVQLRISGLQIQSDEGSSTSSSSNSNDQQSGSNSIGTMIEKVTDRISTNGLVPGLIQVNPINVQGSIDLPFGEFEILYLDNEFRIIQTGQNYYAINIRQSIGSEWF